MTSVTLFNPNAGPLTLDHDSHPHDLATEKRIRDIPMHLRDFRYHGYPEESFLQPKKPGKRPLSEEEKLQSKYGENEDCHASFEKENIDQRANFLRRNEYNNPRNVERCTEQNTAAQQKVPVVVNQDVQVKDHFTEIRAFELEKREKQRQEAQEDIARFKEEQKRKLKEEVDDKKKEYERSTKYYFWDSRNTGHGAPKEDGDNRKQKFVEEEITAKEPQTHNSSEFKRGYLYTPKSWRAEAFNENVGKYGGSGAPLKTESGSAQTHLKMHPTLHYQNKENIPLAFNEQLRYNQNSTQRDQYGKDLLKQKQDKDLCNQEERIKELKRELELLKGNDPYGKPGAGAPNKSNSESFTQRNETKYLAVEEPTFPTPSPRRRLHHYEETSEPYFPFGRPGAGAPLVDGEGNVIAAMKNKLERNTTSADDRRKARAARIYFQELKQEEAELKRQRHEVEMEMKAPEGEFASLIKEGQVGKPKRDPITGVLLNQHLPISDVSKFKMNSQSHDLDEQRIYHEDLTKQADDRHRIRELNRLKDQQQSKQHYDVMDDYWGRYGGGAPKDPLVRRKAILDNTINSPGRELDYSQARRDELNIRSDDNYSTGRVSPTSGRNVNSTHKNQYDYSQDKSDRPYRQGAPYATSYR